MTSAHKNFCEELRPTVLFLASITGPRVVFQAHSSKRGLKIQEYDSVTCGETVFIFTQVKIVSLFLPAQRIVNKQKLISSTEGPTEGWFRFSWDAWF